MAHVAPRKLIDVVLVDVEQPLWLLDVHLEYLVDTVDHMVLITDEPLALHIPSHAQHKVSQLLLAPDQALSHIGRLFTLQAGHDLIALSRGPHIPHKDTILEWVRTYPDRTLTLLQYNVSNGYTQHGTVLCTYQVDQDLYTMWTHREDITWCLRQGGWIIWPWNVGTWPEHVPPLPHCTQQFLPQL